MSFENIDGINMLTMDMVTTTAFAGVLLVLGYFFKKQFPLLERLCMPAPVIGGVLFSVTALILRNTDTMQFTFNTALQVPFMIAFFTCVGFGGSFKLLKTGGIALGIFLAICWVLSIIQNAVGVGLATALGMHPLMGVMAGTVSMTGGHGNAAAFGPKAEALGAVGASTVAIAAATYGLIVGALIGGPVGQYFIKKYNVKIETQDVGLTEEEIKKSQEVVTGKITAEALMKHMVFVGVFMVLGTFINNAVNNIGIPNLVFPGYVGAMFLMIIFRNINDKFSIIKVDQNIMDTMRDVSLGFFLAMAIKTLRMWELVDLALPLLVILLVQTVIVLLMIRFVVWPLMGKNYDAATMSAGFTGVGIGVTPTGIASMASVNERYKKMSLKAMLIVPLCNAVFIDIVAIPNILFFLGAFS